MSEINFKGIFKGIIFSVAVTFITMLLITVISYFSDVSSKVVDILVFAGLGLGILSGAFAVSKSAEKRGALNGLGVGVGTLIIFLICSFSINGKIVFNSHMVSILCVCLFSAFLGGILGKN